MERADILFALQRPSACGFNKVRVISGLCYLSLSFYAHVQDTLLSGTSCAILLPRDEHFLSLFCTSFSLSVADYGNATSRLHHRLRVDRYCCIMRTVVALVNIVCHTHVSADNLQILSTTVRSEDIKTRRQPVLRRSGAILPRSRRTTQKVSSDTFAPERTEKGAICRNDLWKHDSSQKSSPVYIDQSQYSRRETCRAIS